jgi:multiple sugar transport system permease protein
MQRKILIFGFLFLPVLLLVLFLVWPTCRMVFYSFTNWDGTLPAYDFIGLKNYSRAITDETLWLSLKNNGVYALVAILQNVVALFFAVILSGRMRGRGFYKVVIFMPYVLNITAVAYMFSFMYDFNAGPINLFMRHVGLEPIRFFSDTHIAIFSLVSMSAWRWLGYTMVIYIAALQSIEPDIYESSSIDGANSWQTFRLITLPSILRVVELQLFISLSGALQAFTESLVLTRGGPAKATYTFMYYVIDSFVNFSDYGRAAAMSVLLIVLILAIAGIQRLVVRRGATI